MTKHHKTVSATREASQQTAATSGKQRDILGMLAGILIVYAVLTPTDALAYLDPGTGTFALQGLIAGIAGGVLGLRSYWKRIGDLFRRPKASCAAGPEQPLPHGDT
jgi:hypothetical protein